MTHADDGNVKHDRNSGPGSRRGSYRAREHCDPQIVIPFIPRMITGTASELMPVGVGNKIQLTLFFGYRRVEILITLSL